MARVLLSAVFCHSFSSTVSSAGSVGLMSDSLGNSHERPLVRNIVNPELGFPLEHLDDVVALMRVFLHVSAGR